MWVAISRHVAAGLLAILYPLVSNGASAFAPGDAYRVEPEMSFRSDAADLDPFNGATFTYSFEPGTFTDFLFQNRTNQHYVYVNAWGPAFPDFDYAVSATDSSGEGVDFLRQNNGDVVLQETVGTPAVFHQAALDSENGFSVVHSFQFPQGSKRVTLLQGTNGGFLVSETVSNVTRIALFDRDANFVKEWATENYQYVNGPNIGVFIDGSVVISGEVDPLVQTAGAGGTTSQIQVSIFDSYRPDLVDIDTTLIGYASDYLLFARNDTRDVEQVKDPLKRNGLLPFLLAIGTPQRTPQSALALKSFTQTSPIKNGASTNAAGSGLAVLWIDDNLTLARGLNFPDLTQNDPYGYFNLSVSAGKGNEIVFPAHMSGSTNAPSFLVLVRLDLDTGKVQEAVRFQLDTDYTFDRFEYRSGHIFGELYAGSHNLLFKCDPLNLASLQIDQVTNTSSHPYFSFPDTLSQPLYATWGDPVSSDDFVAAFDDNFDETFSLHFEPVIPAMVESFTPTANDLGSVAGTPTDVLVEQTNPQWANLLQPYSYDLPTISPVTLNLTQTWQAFRLVGEPDGSRGLRVHFPTLTGYDYQLRSATDPAGLQSPGAIVETIAGTGSDVVRDFAESDAEKYFAVTAVPTP